MAVEPATADHKQAQSTAPSGEESTLQGADFQGRVTQNFEIYNPHSEEQLRTLKELGFTQVILDWPNLHDVASRLGFNIVMANWWTPQTESESLERGVAYAKQVDPQRLVAVSMMDEPERNSPETPLDYYEALYNDLRNRFDQELPGVKLEISHWGPLKSWSRERYTSFIPLYRGADRIRLMPYPDLDEGPLNEVCLQMLRSRRLMELAGRELPQVVILQTWVLPEDPKLPTIEELRVMAYEALLCGADTISFFSYDPELWNKTEGFALGFAGLMEELTRFSRRYRDATVAANLAENGVLTARLTFPDTRSVSVIVNTNRSPVQDLAALEVVVLEEDLSPRCCESAARRWTSRQGLPGKLDWVSPKRRFRRGARGWRGPVCGVCHKVAKMTG